MLILELILLIALLGVDLISKHIVSSALSGGSKVIIPDILTFVYSENYGASFGIFSGKPYLILAISITASVAILAYLLIFKRTHKFLRLSLIAILSGALGNILDRIIYGYVRDFIDYTFLTTWFNINFAICNVADIFLTVGAIMLIVYVIFIYQEKPKVMSAKPNKKRNRKGQASPCEEESVKESLVNLSGKGSDFTCYDDGGDTLKIVHTKSSRLQKKESTILFDKNSEDKDDK